MKIITIFVFTLIAVLAVFFAFGCAQQGKSFGQPITEAKLTPISDILAKPEQFAGKTVRIEGKIMVECPSGCWFFLKDATGTIYVNLNPSNFAIPQVRGHEVIVQGAVKKGGPQLEVTGEGVQIK